MGRLAQTSRRRPPGATGLSGLGSLGDREGPAGGYPFDPDLTVADLHVLWRGLEQLGGGFEHLLLGLAGRVLDRVTCHVRQPAGIRPVAVGRQIRVRLADRHVTVRDTKLLRCDLAQNSQRALADLALAGPDQGFAVLIDLEHRRAAVIVAKVPLAAHVDRDAHAKAAEPAFSRRARMPKACERTLHWSVRSRLLRVQPACRGWGSPLGPPVDGPGPLLGAFVGVPADDPGVTGG